MQINAKSRLLAGAPDMGRLIQILPEVAQIMRGDGDVAFTASNLSDSSRPYSMYPTLGRFRTASYRWLLTTDSLTGDEQKLTICMEVTDSNTLLNYGKPADYAKARKELGVVVKKLGALKMKLAVLAPGRPPKANGSINLAPAGASKEAWGIKVTSGDGRTSHVFKGTEHHVGPWPSKQEAQFAVQDLALQLEYDDDYKYPTFQVVRVV